MTFAFLSPFYLWLKALHIISFVCWMAGLFYLPRLFVYHTQQSSDAKTYQTFLAMEEKLLKIIMRPSLCATFFFGILLALTPNVVNFSRFWFWVKMLCVLLMAAFHGQTVRWWKALKKGAPPHSETFFRVANEVPTLLFIVIVLCAVLKT